MPEEVRDERVLRLARRMVKIKARAVEGEDAEVQWLADYALRVVREAALVLDHLGRLGGVEFEPKRQLERALADEVSRDGR